MVGWNFQGYPWRRDHCIGLVLKENKLIILLETYEHEGCRVQCILGYKKLSI